MSAAEYAVALDVGGTFTDVTLADLSRGRLWSLKTPTTPDDPSEGVAAGVSQALQDAGLTGADLTRVLHATTTATNAILEQKGVRTGLVTSTGFRYALEIGRHDSPRRVNKYLWVKPRRPVTPEHVLEVDGRIGPRGEVEQPLDEAQARAAVQHFRRAGITSIAVCLLYSYANPEHERQVARILQEAYPEAQVSLSVDVLPVFREYERSMATVLNAYVMPLVSSYIGGLVDRLNELDVRSRFYVMKSNGGLVSPEVVRVQPVSTALSGPAAAVIGATRLARAAGFDDIISIDMGGTSADVCLVNGGEPSSTDEGEIGDWPLHLNMINIHTIGAGGGSIARVSEQGILTVGPASAGARPGPVCYGLGGTEPTVTDANLVLGRVPPALLDGRMPLDREAAARAIQERVAAPLGIGLYEAASGIVEIVNNNMMGALRIVSIERGEDPREYTLVPGGGAGPVHAADLADLLQMPAVLVPPRPGVLSTFGLLFSDLRNDFARTHVRRLSSCSPREIEDAFAELERQARAWLDAEQVPADARSFARFASLRYVNQMFELTLPWPAEAAEDDVLRQLAEAFHRRHLQLYTYNSPDAAVELVTLRLQASGALRTLDVQPLPEGAAGAEPEGRRSVYFNRATGFVETPLYRRERLAAGTRLHGPALIDQMDTSTVVPPGFTCEVDRLGNLILRPEGVRQGAASAVAAGSASRAPSGNGVHA